MNGHEFCSQYVLATWEAGCYWFLKGCRMNAIACSGVYRSFKYRAICIYALETGEFEGGEWENWGGGGRGG